MDEDSSKSYQDLKKRYSLGLYRCYILISSLSRVQTRLARGI